MTPPPTLAETWATRHHVPPDRVTRALFWRALPPGWWPVAVLLGGPAAAYFAADRAFVAEVAALRRPEGFADAHADYQSHPANRGFLRRRLHCRVSSRRLWRLARTLLPAVPGPLTPFRSASRGLAESSP
jgi:hypothetical protein